MDDARHALLLVLADGRCHSGADLGRRLGCSRAAIWKQVRGLRSLGLDIGAGRGRGYQLSRPVELLTESALLAALDAETRRALASLEVLLSTGSTSDRVAAVAPPQPGYLKVSLAEHQTAGRGRRGRRWLSPLGSGICLSVAWCYEVPPPDFPSLGLVVGLAVTEALGSLGIRDIGVKWPNDVMTSTGKLAGILVDVAGETGGPMRVIIGIGLNTHRTPGLDADVAADGGAAQPAALEQLAVGSSVSRNRVAAALVSALHRSLAVFGAEGFGPFVEAFRRQDYLCGRPVRVTSGTHVLHGMARGIGLDGTLLVESAGVVTRVVAGDVTLRVTA